MDDRDSEPELGRVRLPDGTEVEARVTDDGAGVELRVEKPGEVVRFPVERTRKPGDGG